MVRTIDTAKSRGGLAHGQPARNRVRSGFNQTLQWSFLTKNYWYFKENFKFKCPGKNPRWKNKETRSKCWKSQQAFWASRTRKSKYSEISRVNHFRQNKRYKSVCRQKIRWCHRWLEQGTVIKKIASVLKFIKTTNFSQITFQASIQVRRPCWTKRKAHQWWYRTVWYSITFSLISKMVLTIFQTPKATLNKKITRQNKVGNNKWNNLRISSHRPFDHADKN